LTDQSKSVRQNSLVVSRLRWYLGLCSLVVAVSCGTAGAAKGTPEPAEAIPSTTEAWLTGQAQARTEIERTTFASGEWVNVVVVVANNSGAEIPYQLCGDLPYAGQLEDADAGVRSNETGTQATCRGEPRQIPIGESRWSVRVPTTLLSCTRSDAIGAIGCTSEGLLPNLPAGRYVLRIEGVNDLLPIPPALDIELK
jgi:hypothetical protein